MTTEERIERLEKSLKQWRRNTVALIGIAAVVLVSGAVDSTPGELTVRRLIVVDENGVPCITLLRKSSVDFTGIVMEQPVRNGEANGGSIALVASKDGASLRLGFGSDDDNKEAASLVVNRNEKARLFFSDDKKKGQNP